MPIENLSWKEIRELSAYIGFLLRLRLGEKYFQIDADKYIGKIFYDIHVWESRRDEVVSNYKKLIAKFVYNESRNIKRLAETKNPQLKIGSFDSIPEESDTIALVLEVQKNLKDGFIKSSEEDQIRLQECLSLLGEEINTLLYDHIVAGESSRPLGDEMGKSHPTILRMIRGAIIQLTLCMEGDDS